MLSYHPPQDNTSSLWGCVGPWVPPVISTQHLQHAIVLKTALHKWNLNENYCQDFTNVYFFLQDFHFLSILKRVCSSGNTFFWYEDFSFWRNSCSDFSKTTLRNSDPLHFPSLSLQHRWFVHHLSSCACPAVCLAALVNRNTEII